MTSFRSRRRAAALVLLAAVAPLLISSDPCFATSVLPHAAMACMASTAAPAHACHAHGASPAMSAAGCGLPRGTASHRAARGGSCCDLKPPAPMPAKPDVGSALRTPVAHFFPGDAVVLLEPAGLWIGLSSAPTVSPPPLESRAYHSSRAPPLA